MKSKRERRGIKPQYDNRFVELLCLSKDLIELLFTRDLHELNRTGLLQFALRYGGNGEMFSRSSRRADRDIIEAQGGSAGFEEMRGRVGRRTGDGEVRSEMEKPGSFNGHQRFGHCEVLMVWFGVLLFLFVLPSFHILRGNRIFMCRPRVSDHNPDRVEYTDPSIFV